MKFATSALVATDAAFMVWQRNSTAREGRGIHIDVNAASARLPARPRMNLE